MPAIQTTYGDVLAPAYEGMIANSTDHTIISYQCETAAGIGFGKVAVIGATADQIRVSEATRKFIGITEASHTAQSVTDTYVQNETVPVVVQGEMWVLASVAVAAGDLAYYVPATGVLTNVATANTALPNGYFTSTTTGAGLAKVRFG